MSEIYRDPKVFDPWEDRPKNSEEVEIAFETAKEVADKNAEAERRAAERARENPTQE